MYYKIETYLDVYLFIFTNKLTMQTYSMSSTTIVACVGVQDLKHHLREQEGALIAQKGLLKNALKMDNICSNRLNFIGCRPTKKTINSARITGRTGSNKINSRRCVWLLSFFGHEGTCTDFLCSSERLSLL